MTLLSYVTCQGYDFSNQSLAEVLQKVSKETDKPSFLLIHEDDRVKFWQFPFISPPEVKYIRELRFFSLKGEFYLWRKKEGLWESRWRDEEKMNGKKYEEVHTYEEVHLIWGTDVHKEENGEYILKEGQRGMKISFPFAIQKSQLPLRYLVRNYYRFDENGLIYFYDARLVELQDREGNKIQS